MERAAGAREKRGGGDGSKVFVRLRVFAGASLVMCLVLLGVGCQKPCVSGQILVSRHDPNGQACTRLCDCNNLRFEGKCVSGVCRSQVREACSNPGSLKACTFAGASGVCTQGKRECQPQPLEEALWGDCKQAEVPAREICDGLDNDCDGQIDNKLNAPNCPNETALCAGATQTCQGAAGWAPCRVANYVANNSAYEATETRCDGKDNDCDGAVDNIANPPACPKQSGACKGARQACSGANGWIPCASATYALHSEAYEARETRCDGKDNDCDGAVDETHCRDAFTQVVCRGGAPQEVACRADARCEDGRCSQPSGCAIQVTPTKLSFRAPKKIQVTVSNIGGGDCVVKKIYLKKGAPFALLPTPEPNKTIASGGRLDFLVSFTPVDQRTHRDALVIESSDPEKPTIEVPVESRIVDPPECGLVASPASLDFQVVAVGKTFRRSVTIVNQGWGDCDLSRLSIIGTNPTNNMAFALLNTPSLPQKMSPGTQLTLEVSYTPPAVRSGYEGKLIVKVSDSGQQDFEVLLRGAVGNPCLEVLPADVDFGSAKFGCSAPTRTVEVYHLGASGCASSINISSLVLASASSAEFGFQRKPTLPVTLAPKQSLSFALSYKPKDLGVDTGTVELSNDIPGQSPRSIPLVGEGVSSSEQKDVFKQPTRPLADILFVVDDSSSMGNEQADLASNFKSFIQWASSLQVDYQIGITTTDTTGSSRRFPAGCLQGTPRIITPQTPNVISTFSANVKVGTIGSSTERGLEASYRALSLPTSNDPNCNRGFLRKDASLSIIYVSDEVDQSPQTVAFYASFLKQLKGPHNFHLIRASAIGAYAANSPECSAGTCRYYELSKLLSGNYAAITKTNWSTTLSDLGALTFAVRNQFFLSRQADASTIKVKVNGTDIKEDPQDGWQYDASANAIAFSRSRLPPPGATISVEYTATCLP